MMRYRSIINRTLSPLDPKQANDPDPWVNLHETDQINLDNMFAGIVDESSSPGNGASRLIRFLAKANRPESVYVTSKAGQ